MTKKTVNLVMAVANDSGNGYSKTYFQFEDDSNSISVTPSLYAPVTTTDSIPNLDDMDTESYNNMDVIIKSPTLKTTSEYLVGQAAMASGNSLMDYNVEANTGKATPDISIIVPLAKIAYAALNQYIKNTHSIPATINVTLVFYLTCLPISEFRNSKKRNFLKKRLCKGKHVVTIKGLDSNVKVNINFSEDNTYIYPEGIAAQIGLIYDPVDSRYYRQGELYQDAPYEDGKAYHDSGNVLLIDIGDGTTDISIMHATRPLKGLGINTSLNQGVGTAAAMASDQLAIDYPQLRYTRSVFLEHAKRQDSEGSTLAKKYLEPQLNLLMAAIENEVEKEFRKANNDINTVVVLGGGVNLLTDNNKKEFQSMLDELNPFEVHKKVWWITSKYNQMLNLDGLRVFLSRKLNKN